MKKIAIIGLGFVGSALEKAIRKEKSIIAKIDPKLNTSVKNLIDFRPEIIFITVPTPMLNNGDQDISIVKNVLSEIKIHNIKSLIVIKSTILPSNIQPIFAKLKNCVYNPEFLREMHAYDDFIKGELIVFGGEKKLTDELATFYNNFTKCINKEYIYTDPIAASMIKYCINSYLATKVTYFNQLNSVFNASGTSESWENFIFAINKDKRIGNTHMDVPGHDGLKGFGGACLPKDTNSFFKYSRMIGKPFSLLNHVLKVNNKIRSGYNHMTSREKEQNINFKGER